MRTTITLDDRLGRRLKDEMRSRGTSFRETLESVLMEGLEQRSSGRKARDFRVRARPLGIRRGIDPARLQDLDTDLEVDRFLEISKRKETVR